MRTTFFDKDPLANDIDKYDDPRYAPIEDDFVEQDKIEKHRFNVQAAIFPTGPTCADELDEESRIAYYRRLSVDGYFKWRASLPYDETDGYARFAEQDAEIRERLNITDEDEERWKRMKREADQPIPF